MSPLASLGEAYEHIYLSAVPALQLSLPAASASTSLPAPLRAPLLKGGSGPYVGVRSGTRSGLLRSGDRWFRLKGCGCAPVQQADFPLQPLGPMLEGGMEVRGCCFAPSVARELYMTAAVNSVLAAAGSGTVGGNVPVGWWRYALPDDDLPRIGKFAGVYVARSEKRLATHLLAGLDLLLPLLAVDASADTLRAALPPARIKEDGSVRPSWTVCDYVECEPGADYDDGNDDALVDARACVALFLHSAASDGCLSEEVPASVLESSGVPEATLRATWRKSVAELAALGDSAAAVALQLLPELYWRLGHECGAVLRLLRDADINWGYFIDHNPFEPHCNAHPNNLVVLPPAPGRTQLLAPVDFDMAFPRAAFAAEDASLFDAWQHSSRAELQRALGGEENMGNFVYGDSSSSSESTELLRVMLRDTLVLGFRAGNAKKPLEVNEKAEQAVRALIELALLCTEGRAS
eukprot:PLAT1408.2.p1 GENE.PLAT1408.2~~PLAT1408.2.p1  ORF type:complete len:464 (+),score=217.45 PLAT1408.2:367-1758(+)